MDNQINGYIYYIQNQINNKTYIGLSIQPDGVRIENHKYRLNKGNHHNRYLQNSWNKYGSDNFEFGVLEKGFETIEELSEAEIFWIKFLRSRSFQTGYNILEGGIDDVPKNQSNTEEFIIKSKAIHGNKYDYSKVDYNSSSDKVKIICKIHGEFKKRPNSFLNGFGCTLCSSGTIWTTSENIFMKKAKEVHGDSYSYDKVDYKKSSIKVLITCDQHGDFKQTPNHHLQGQGCPVCADKSTKVRHIKTGKVYESQREASKQSGVLRITISRHCKGVSCKDNPRWEYAE